MIREDRGAATRGGGRATCVDPAPHVEAVETFSCFGGECAVLVIGAGLRAGRVRQRRGPSAVC